MYPTEMVAPMKAELVDAGYKELLSEAEVTEALDKSGTTLVAINSVCGCSAGSMRPAMIQALDNDKLPDNLTTSFAGYDVEAVAHVRKFMLPYPPSSPSIALFKDGKIAMMVERHHIEGNTAEAIADHLRQAFDEFC
ncbi:MAG: BrxA/BrxB family bacilliredoxin [Bacteroidetes bacterium]|jgi:putative YphP/YqiW family bacilliredoxin|nr:BrxA/BrxB family bacilliredoxin [Bacteroidota bacterium]MDA0732168.1 BrxA/BrxB family bacilliredoxin [Bacteroidota bacterium]MDA0980424.1 BrxA/BrxB family bacilliredoxin [Bacteroidota bacterium]|tara:strand:+ start:2103 stop:2513 length:411 start_codon:yes stop_codon:yes gene_type:complete